MGSLPLKRHVSASLPDRGQQHDQQHPRLWPLKKWRYDANSNHLMNSLMISYREKYIIMSIIFSKTWYTLIKHSK
jgi:hypothetical protein